MGLVDRGGLVGLEIYRQYKRGDRGCEIVEMRKGKLRCWVPRRIDSPKGNIFVVFFYIFRVFRFAKGESQWYNTLGCAWNQHTASTSASTGYLPSSMCVSGPILEHRRHSLRNCWLILVRVWPRSNSWLQRCKVVTPMQQPQRKNHLADQHMVGDSWGKVVSFGYFE